MRRSRNLTPTQRALEAAAKAPFVAVFVGLAVAGELLELVPDPRLALWAARDLRVRRIR